MKKILYIMILIIPILFAGYDASAMREENVIYARARVLPVLKYSVIHQESSINITKADLEKGYLDVNRALILSIKTNSANGYSLSLFVDSNLFNGVTLFNENNSYRFTESGGEVHMPFQGLNPVRKELSFRLYFAADLKSGHYQWPVSVMINAM